MDPQTWKTQIRTQLQQTAQTGRELAPESVYGFLAASTLMPLITAVGQGDLAALSALFTIVSGVGGGLIANQLQAWKARSAADLAPELAAKAAADPAWRDALDTLLANLETPQLIGTVLSEADRNWFLDQLRTELAEIGSSVQIEVSGSGAAVVGNDNVVAGERGVGELAPRPLLLTLMASLHAWRGGSLPDGREALYEESIDLLMEIWERPKIVHNRQGQAMLQSASAAEYFAAPRARIREALEAVAFTVHREQEETTGSADIHEAQLVTALLKVSTPDTRPARVLEYIRDRAGLLINRGEGVYSFSRAGVGVRGGLPDIEWIEVQVGVSRYEAVAFCNWLAEQVGYAVSLPTEAQWERAARGTDGRIYPWGHAEEAAQRCNMGETGIGSTSAVGLFPAGRAVCDAEDMSGNVLEWCRTKWLDDYENYAGRVDDKLSGTDLRVWRGGAFDDGSNVVRCAYRHGLSPEVRYGRLGFRCVSLGLNL